MTFWKKQKIEDKPIAAPLDEQTLAFLGEAKELIAKTKRIDNLRYQYDKLMECSDHQNNRKSRYLNGVSSSEQEWMRMDFPNLDGNFHRQMLVRSIRDELEGFIRDPIRFDQNSTYGRRKVNAWDDERPSLGVLLSSLREIYQTKYEMPSKAEIERENSSRGFSVQEFSPEEWEVKKRELGINTQE